MTRSALLYGAAVLSLTAVGLAGCDDATDETANSRDDARSIQSDLPADYFDIPPRPPEPAPLIIEVPAPPPPEPEPEPEPVVLAPPEPPPAPPPPPDTSAQERALAALLAVQQRDRQGPAFRPTVEPAPPANVPDPRYQNTDEDYTRDSTPRTDSGFPVDRSFILTQERVITAVTRYSINSQIPGEVHAIVDQNIYGDDDRYVLIERGSTLIGRYEPLEAQGDTRLNVVFYRILRPDGAHLYSGDIDAGFAYAADAMGRTGLVGEIDNRYWERYGSALITAGIGALAGAASTYASSDTEVASQASNNLTQQLGQVTARNLEDQIDLAPIITVAASEPINVFLTEDLFIRRPELIEQ